ncbi:hypothetical protein PsorP6_015101 [Peronosclerospora sorghi]|uniref:Uncharacterized protein n=1 Tax=Peronosclerospora sorghi TaxID=230839 RepID=A0ACC0VT66_9STRA|nr:hypothetical protein PsorP6_015101 [Peronosclerospora sorghi]
MVFTRCDAPTRSTRFRKVLCPLHLALWRVQSQRWQRGAGRLCAFAINVERMTAHKKTYERGEESFVLGRNHLPDLSDSRIQLMRYCKRRDAQLPRR